MIIKKNKKAISIMIGYILLVSFAVIIGAIVFQWIKTYVPTESLECPDGASLFIKDYNYNCSSNILTISFGNNGRFNIGGFFIYATNSTEQELATYDLSEFSKGNVVGNVVKFPGFSKGNENSFKAGNSVAMEFNLTGSDIGTIYSIRIVPVRWQKENSKKHLVSCSNSKVKEMIYCS